jgi:N utilization substance protein B
MAVVDRNILRLAVYEMLWGGDVPAKVVINEAIEIAKKFGTGESSRFINGILDRVLRELRPSS